MRKEPGSLESVPLSLSHLQKKLVFVSLPFPTKKNAISLTTNDNDFKELERFDSFLLATHGCHWSWKKVNLLQAEEHDVTSCERTVFFSLFEFNMCVVCEPSRIEKSCLEPMVKFKSVMTRKERARVLQGWTDGGEKQTRVSCFSLTNAGKKTKKTETLLSLFDGELAGPAEKEHTREDRRRPPID